MVRQAVAVIGRENDDGIVQIAIPLEGFHNLADLLIDHCHIGQIVGALTMTLLGRRIER